MSKIDAYKDTASASEGTLDRSVSSPVDHKEFGQSVERLRTLLSAEARIIETEPLISRELREEYDQIAQRFKKIDDRFRDAAKNWVNKLLGLENLKAELRNLEQRTGNLIREIMESK